MAGNQPARIPPVRNSWALVTTAGGDGAVPAPAPGAAAEEKEAESPAEAPAGTAGPAATGAFVARVAASPGVNVDAEVRIKMEDGKFVEGVITGRRSVDGSYPVAPLGLSGERGPVLNLMHGRHFFTVAEYERDYASQQGQLSGSAPRMPQIAARDAPTARAPARYTIETVPPGFGFIEGSLVRKVFGGAAARVDKCWPPFLLLAQSAAGEYLDQDVLTLVAAVEQALEGAAGEGVVLAPPVFDVFDDAESVLRAHVLRLGAALKEAATRKAKKQRIEDPSSRQPGAVGLRVMEELLGGSLAPKAKVLCAGLEDAGSTMAVAKAVLGKAPEDDFGRALQRVARSTGSCDVVAKGTFGNTLVTLRKGAEDGMEELAHKSDFGKVPPGGVRAGPASKKGVTLNSALRTGSIEGLHYYSVALVFSEGGYPEWFGPHRFDRAAAADPKRPCGPPEAQSALRAIVRHVVQPLWNFVSPMDQNGPMAFIDLVFQWLDLGVSESFVNGMVCKVHVEFQKAFSGWLDGAVKDPPRIAFLAELERALASHLANSS